VRIVRPGALVLFLSACRSGAKDRTLLLSAVDVFRFFRPSSLIGTLANVPEYAAAVFSIAFYKQLAAGSSVGAALRNSRLHLLDEYENPFGLLFSSYFGENVHILVEQDRRATYFPDETRAILTGIRGSA